MDDVKWTRRETRALAGANASGDDLFAELEDFIRIRNSEITDIRLEQADATEDFEAEAAHPRRWYTVTYLSIGD